jgi:hypothetical protein
MSVFTNCGRAYYFACARKSNKIMIKKNGYFIFMSYFEN